MKLAIIDFETTGLDPKTCFPTEIGIKILATDLFTGEVLKPVTYEELIQLPEGEVVPPFITELTGLTTDKLKLEGIPLRQVVEEVAHLLKGDDIVVVGHNINFDLGFLKEHFGIEAKRFLCTRSIEILTHPHLNASLKNVYPRYYPGDTREQTHRAMGDIEMTEKVLTGQVNEHGVDAIYGYFMNRIVSMPDRELTYAPPGAKVMDFTEKYVSKNTHEDEINRLLLKIEALGEEE